MTISAAINPSSNPSSNPSNNTSINASINVYIDAVAAIGPGADNWLEWRAILQDHSSYQSAKTKTPILSVLPSAERRRIGTGVKIAIACGLEALAMADIDPGTMTTVFSSSGGDGDNCHLICEALAGPDRMISPTRFHNSVHNAPSGYWGIASGAMQPSTSICAFDASFAAGLLEACTQCHVEQKPVLLVAYDAPYPEPLQSSRPIRDQFAVGLLISPSLTRHSLARIVPTLSKAAPTVMQNETLEQLRTGIPAARSLPLLQQLARPSQADAPTQVHLDYVNQRSLCVECYPCLTTVQATHAVA